MPYVVLNTFSPEYDIQRNWSAWIYSAWNTREEALYDLAQESPKFSALQERHSHLDDDEIIQKVIDQEDFDVRYNTAYKQWQHVHHEGLSCYELKATTEEMAWVEARQVEFPWFGFGEHTCGQVRLIGQVQDHLYLYWCEDTAPEMW